MNRLEYIEEVKKQLNYLKKKQAKLLYIQEAIETNLRSLERIDATLDGLDAPGQAMGDVKDLALTILQANARAAITGTEFDIAKEGVRFRENFLKAVSNEDAIDLSYDPVSGIFKVRINMDRVAGSLRTYSSAVESAREAMGVGSYKATPASSDLRSHFWKEKYYRPAREGKTIPQPKGVGKPTEGGKRKKKPRNYKEKEYIKKYWQTMRFRQDFFYGSLAPWWAILEYGVQSPKVRELMYDSDGIAYPQTRGRRFVAETERQIRRVYNESLSGSNKTIQELRTKRTKVINALNYLQSTLARVRRMPDDITDRPDESLTLQLITDQLGDRIGDASPEKIELLCRQLESGNAPPRINLGKTGKEVSFRTRNIQNILRSRGR